MQWLSVVKSVLASFFGVQTQAQYVKDANMPSFVPFLVVGIVMVVLFVISLWLLVQFLLS
ncbi:MAG: DUF2970 domain-containing protein [Glaciecola sp.]